MNSLIQKKSRFTWLITGLFILVALIIILILVKNADSGKPDLSKITRLTNSRDCSTKSMNSVSDERPSSSNIIASEALIDYRASCDYINGNYKSALSNYQILRQYYLKSGNVSYASNVDQQIDITEYNIDHPLVHSNEPVVDVDGISPQLGSKLAESNKP